MKGRRILIAALLLLVLAVVITLSGMGRHHQDMMDKAETVPMPADTTAASNAQTAEVDAAESAFRRTCATCHTLPDPRRHTAREWPAIIVRMERHMTSRGIPPPPDEVLEEITAYLQRNARS